MALTLQTHEYEKVPNTNKMRLKAEHHYVSIKGQDMATPVFVQHGLFYSEGGQLLKSEDLSPAFWDEARKLNAQTRQSVGLVLPEECEQGDASE